MLIWLIAYLEDFEIWAAHFERFGGIVYFEFSGEGIIEEVRESGFMSLSALTSTKIDLLKRFARDAEKDILQ